MCNYVIKCDFAKNEKINHKFKFVDKNGVHF